MKLNLKALRTIAASPGLLRNHLLEVQREFDACDESVKQSGRHEDLHRKYGIAIKARFCLVVWLFFIILD